MDGIVNVLKPPGMSSHDVINLCRKIFGTKKIGHTGTLDPEAAGVLPVCVGKATKLADRIGGESKSYRVVAKLGVVTDSYDLEGNILEEKIVEDMTDEALIEGLKVFLGEIDQLPPIYSAIKVNGKKLYEYALEGKNVEIKPRKIKIHSISFVERISNDEFMFDVVCAKGTYVRSICHDLGKNLGCGAAMKRLIRTASGNFKIENSYTLEELEELKGTALTSIEDYFSSKKRICILDDAVPYTLNGNPVLIKNMDEIGKKLFLSMEEGTEVLLYSHESLLGLAEKRKYRSETGFAAVMTFRCC